MPWPQALRVVTLCKSFSTWISASPKTGRIRPKNSNRRRRIALISIDVKFRTMRDYEISRVLAEFQDDE